MAWAKAWHDTRWRFAIGIAVLAAIVCFNVFEWLDVRTLVPTLDPSAAGGNAMVRRALEEAIAAEQTFRGYIWYQWFAQNFRWCIVLFAALLGSGSALSTSGRGLLFSLALPVARSRWVEARAAIGVLQVLALAVIPSLLIPLLAPFVGESYSVKDALVHGGLIFVLGSVFFALAMLASAIVDDFGRAIVLTAVVAIVVGVAELAFPRGHGLFTALTGGTYYRTGTLPWPELVLAVALTAALIYGAAGHLARRDF
jgi:ABC-2 type transport system permease protein